jgi:hypothetical protein
LDSLTKKYDIALPEIKKECELDIVAAAKKVQ